METLVKDHHHNANAPAHDAFCGAYPTWAAEDLVGYLQDEGLVKRPAKTRGETVCELLRKLHKEDPDFAETTTVRKLAKRIGRSTGGIADSHYYLTVLGPKRELLLVEKKKVRRAQRWGHFESIAAPDRDAKEGH